jgi:aminopeptidase N
MSASLYLTLIEKDPKKFLTFWNDERDLLLERNAQGFRAIDVGPLTMGYRTNNSRTGFDITRRLIYPKGAYVLHMVRMMMHDNKTGDQHFKETMQDFVKTYSGKAATTEDFKSALEKHMTPEMDLEGNHKMDWFFNEYVYGTQLPTYKLDSSFDIGPDGDVIFNMKLAQSGVDEHFRMLVPMYLELADGNIYFLGRARMNGNNTVDQKIPLKGLKTKPKRAIANYYDDVLASPN